MVLVGCFVNDKYYVGIIQIFWCDVGEFFCWVNQ